MPQRGSPSLIDAFDAFLFDIDGVLWLEGEPIAGAVAAIERIRQCGKNVIFLTNKSTGSREEIRARLQRVGLDVRPGELVTSAYAAAVYVRERAGPTRVHAIGSPGCLQEIREQGHTLTDTGATFVVIGFRPPSELTPQVLDTVRRLVGEGAELIACNKDRGNPLPNLSVSLGSFYTVGAIEQAAGATATVIGKPHRPIFDITMHEYGLSPDRCLMIGDSIEADVHGGRAAGIATVLVLSGFTDAATLAASAVQPDYVLPSVADLA